MSIGLGRNQPDITAPRGGVQLKVDAIAAAHGDDPLASIESRNAVEHSLAGARVVVRLLDRDEDVELSVWNEGELREGDADSLFAPFRKGTHSTGMGLGLYISQHIARAHGGEITVASTPEAGTTFRLRLPAATSAANAP